MTEIVIKEQLGRPKSWNGYIMRDFADSLGVSLDKLGKEYDDMIRTFEMQKSQLRNYVPCEGAIMEEAGRSPSPTLSETSQHSLKRGGIKRRTFSAAGISTSIRMARNTLRRKLSTKSQSPSHEPRLTRKKKHSSISSLQGPESESSSMDHETDMKEGSHEI